MDKYEQISVIGEGSYGLVMKWKHSQTDQIVAVKKFLETEEYAVSRKMAIREIRMLKRLKHENLVTMIEAFRYKKRFYIVFEYIDYSLMDELDKSRTGLGYRESKERVFQLIRALGYCHRNRIVHRDVKPENVLVSAQGIVKLCDFGFARILSVSREVCTEYVATRWYRAPELLVGEKNYGTGVDIWATGCLFAEMMTGDPLFPGDSDIDQLYLIISRVGKLCPKHKKLISKCAQLKNIHKGSTVKCISNYGQLYAWPRQASDFLEKCLKMNPSERPGADDLLTHGYFIESDFSKTFLQELRKKVEDEFTNPLLKKVKSEILRLTDKSDEIQQRKVSHDISKWNIALTESTIQKLPS